MSKSNSVPFYDSESGAILQANPQEAQLLKEAGYKTGKDADVAYRADGVVGTGVAGLLGAAHGASFGLSDPLLKNTLPQSALPYMDALEAAHPYAYGLGEFAGAAVGFGKVGGAAKALGYGLKGQAAARVSAAAFGGGVDALDAAQTRGAPLTAEQFVQGVGIGTAMGVFGEGVGGLLHAAVPKFQKAGHSILEKAKASGWYRKVVSKVAETPLSEIPEPPSSFAQAVDRGGQVIQASGVAPPPFTTGAEETTHFTERPVSAADQLTINKNALDKARFQFKQADRGRVTERVNSLDTVSPEEMRAREDAANVISGEKIQKALKTVDLASGKGMNKKVPLTAEEIAQRAEYFRKYDPTITRKRLAHKIALTSVFPPEELYIYAQPEYVWPREGDPTYNPAKSRKKFDKTPQGIAWNIEQQLPKDIEGDLKARSIRSEFGGGGESGTEFNVSNTDEFNPPANVDVEKPRAPRLTEPVQFAEADRERLLAGEQPPADPTFERPDLNTFVRKGGFIHGEYPSESTSDTPFTGTRVESGLRDNINRPHATLADVYSDLMSPTFGQYLDEPTRRSLAQYQEQRAVYNLAKRQHTEDMARFNKRLVKWMNAGKDGPSPKPPIEPSKPLKPPLEFPHELGLNERTRDGLKQLGFRVTIRPPAKYPGIGVGPSQGVEAGFPGQTMKGGRIGEKPFNINAPPVKYQSKWESTDANPLLRWKKNLWLASSVGTAAKVAGALPFIPTLPGAGLAVTAFSAGIGLQGINSALIRALESEGASNTIFNNLLKPGIAKTGDLIRTTVESSIPIVENKVFGGDNVDASYDAVTQSLSNMSANPYAVEEHLRETYHPAIGQDDKAHANIVGVSANAIQYLANIAPKDPSPPALIKKKWSPTRSEKVKFLTIVQAINNPLDALKDPNIESVKAVAAVYPETLRNVRNAIVSHILNNPDIEFSPNQAKRVSLITSTPATVGMDPGYISRLQKVASANRMPQNDGNAGAMSGGRQRSVKVNQSSANSLAAPSQQNAVENA